MKKLVRNQLRRAYRGQNGEKHVDKFRSRRTGQLPFQLGLQCDITCSSQNIHSHKFFPKAIFGTNEFKDPNDAFTSRLKPYLIFWRQDTYSSVDGRLMAGAAGKNTYQIVFVYERPHQNARKGITFFLWTFPFYFGAYPFALLPFLCFGFLYIHHFIHEDFQIFYNLVEDFLRRSTCMHQITCSRLWELSCMSMLSPREIW